MTLRAKGARKRQGYSPRRQEEGTVTVCPEAGRERRLMDEHLGARARAAVNRERRAPAARSRAFIQDAGRRFAAIPHSPLPSRDGRAQRGSPPSRPAACAPWLGWLAGRPADLTMGGWRVRL